MVAGWPSATPPPAAVVMIPLERFTSRTRPLPESAMKRCPVESRASALAHV
jgi:hypothetical protein